MVQHCMVCFMLNLENLLTTQKPESFGSEQPMPPAQIASPIRTGETPESRATMGAMMDDVVTSATVVEPCAALNIWLIAKQTTINRRPAEVPVQPDMLSTSALPMPVALMTEPNAPPAPVMMNMAPACSPHLLMSSEKLVRICP